MREEVFDRKEYESLKHRVEALESRIKLDKDGNEREIAKNLLSKVRARLEEYEKTHYIPPEEKTTSSSQGGYNTTYNPDYRDYLRRNQGFTRDQDWRTARNQEWRSAQTSESFFRTQRYQEDYRSAAEMSRDLGVLYAIFGSTYQTVFEGHTYKIRFKKEHENNDGAFYRVWSDIYEDDTLIAGDVIIGFWPFHRGDTRCGDMEISWMSESTHFKYFDNCYVFKNVINELADYWNDFFTGRKTSMTVRHSPSDIIWG